MLTGIFILCAIIVITLIVFGIDLHQIKQLKGIHQTRLLSEFEDVKNHYLKQLPNDIKVKNIIAGQLDDYLKNRYYGKVTYLKEGKVTVTYIDNCYGHSEENETFNYINDKGYCLSIKPEDFIHYETVEKTPEVIQCNTQ